MRLQDSSSPTRRPAYASPRTHADVRPAPHDHHPRPEFLEMVGRLAGSYCPPLLSTDVVGIARAALVGQTEGDMDAVEVVARTALDVAVVRLDGHRSLEDLAR